MPQMASAVVPDPSAPMNLIGTMLTCQLTPVTPRPLLPAAPRMPDTWVPWPLSSLGSLEPARQFQPFTSSTKPFPSSSTPLLAQPEHDSPGFAQLSGARSGGVRSPPGPRPPALTAREPVVTSHAEVAWMSSPAVPG